MNKLKLKLRDETVLDLPQPWIPIQRPPKPKNWGGWGGC